MKCTLCNKQYVGKAETTFNIRLNKHRKDTKDPNAILARKILDTEIKNLISLRTEPTTQQIENKDLHAAFSRLFLLRPQQPSHLRTLMMT